MNRRNIRTGLLAAMALAVAAASWQPLSAAATRPKGRRPPARSAAAVKPGTLSWTMRDMIAKVPGNVAAIRLTGDVDRDFALLMQSYQQTGLLVARVEAQGGKDPKMRELAARIIAAQERELAQFKDFLVAPSPSPSPGRKR
ncbi:MAG TPA: DUF305 domain-containing protein [Vicinamibacteria bacterium]|jgi:uncharacterized protein (DUF305 family)|nr:DUF305 domain-containing protein [Vicinamibacteria bacterium]